jgi:uncharacterized protein (TIGR00303 family)
VIQIITGNPDYIKEFQNKKATFMLALSNTATANIEGITQAGIPGMIHLTPVLDAEFLATGEVRSLPNIAQTTKGVPTPALITRAIHLIKPFSHIEFLDLGLKRTPKVDSSHIHSFNITPSDSITTEYKGANIEAKAIFDKAVAFGKSYICKDDYIILGESVPSGTTTANATALALGYKVDGLFSSSFKDTPTSIKKDAIRRAIANIKQSDNIWSILSKVADNMLIFNAGFILGVNGRFPILLAGGTQMACVLLVVNSIRGLTSNDLLQGNESSACLTPYAETSLDNLALSTTKWVAQDENSNIKTLLEMLNFPINAYYADFDFCLSDHPALKLYDEGEAKEGVGAGGALVYGFLNALNQEDITKEIEALLS